MFISKKNKTKQRHERKIEENNKFSFATFYFSQEEEKKYFGQ